MPKTKTYKDYNEYLMTLLKDQEAAMAYLYESLKDSDPMAFPRALKNVVAAGQFEKTKLAKEVKISKKKVNHLIADIENLRWDEMAPFISYVVTQYKTQSMPL